MDTTDDEMSLFHKIGSQYDGHGNLRNWWNDMARSNFLIKKQCYETQYSRYSMDINGKLKFINGALTIGENMADNSGLLHAWKAYSRY